MARASKLKVYRLTIGFHDAYVAAPSQKAAAEAWGSDKDVFARGQAELVTDSRLTEAALARPGEVIKRLRGSAAEQLAALGADDAGGSEPAARRRPDSRGRSRTRPSPRSGPSEPKPLKTKLSKPKPRPDRTKLDEAEQSLTAAAARHETALRALAERQAVLARERVALEKKQEVERERLQTRRDKAEAAYEQALRRWRESG